MAFICILCGGLQVLLLLSLTGVLVSLAALSRLMELTFMIVQPTVLFMLRQSVRLIVFLTVLILQRMSLVLGTICSRQPIDRGSSNDSPIPETGMKIGTTPMRVPYVRNNHETERLADMVKKLSSPIVRVFDTPEEVNEVFEDAVSRISSKSAKTISSSFDPVPELYGMPSAKVSQSFQLSGEQDDKTRGTNISEEATSSTS